LRDGTRPTGKCPSTPSLSGEHLPPSSGPMTLLDPFSQSRGTMITQPMLHKRSPQSTRSPAPTQSSLLRSEVQATKQMSSRMLVDCQSWWLDPSTRMEMARTAMFQPSPLPRRCHPKSTSQSLMLECRSSVPCSFPPCPPRLTVTRSFLTLCCPSRITAASTPLKNLVAPALG